ncbi:MAG: MBL fold metallo-hydrolase, partial [Desulfobacteraceae bacterium]|nr:MBL fold metallo-hydrolase [Desulfobacteraceae bacterium]
FPKREKGKERIRQKLAFLEDFWGKVQDAFEEGIREPRMIFRQLKLKEDTLKKYFCFGNVSMLNGVRSVVCHLENN